MARRGIVLVLALLVVSVAGVVALRQPRAAAAIRVITVGKTPSAIAIDAATRRVFVLNADSGTVSVIDADSAALLRTIAAGPDPESISIDERDGRILVTTAKLDTAAILDARSGAVVRRAAVGYGAAQAVVDEQMGQAFVSAGALSVVDMRGGAAITLPLDRTGIVATLEPMAIDQRTHRLFVLNGATTPPRLTVLDTASGARLRSFPIGVDTSSTGIDARSGRVFIASPDDNTVYVLDARDGRVLRTVGLGFPPGAVVVDSAMNRAFAVPGVLGGAGRVAMLDATTGALLHTLSVGTSGGAVALDSRHGRLYLFDGQRVHVLDARTGEQRCAIAAPLTPVAVAVDESARRLFVVNPDNPEPAPDPWSWLPQGLRQRLPFVPQASFRMQTPAGSISVLDARCQ